jgi:type IV pilus assembly protein PilA
VVAIILIIAAIAVPSLLKAKLAANDSAGASTMRTINTSEVTYSTTYPTHGYAQTLTILGGVPIAVPTETQANMIDSTLGCAAAPCPKGGYNYSLNSVATAIPYGSYTSTAWPITKGSTGQKVYCSTVDNVIRVDQAAAATAAITDAVPSPCLAAPYVPIQ